MNERRHPYDKLTPDLILDAVETYGVRCTGGLLALNSYENRVYRVDVEDGAPLVAKFYRPGRWSDAAILEEHAFARALADLEIPVVAPLPHADGGTLRHFAGFRFTVFPWQPGRAPELNTAEDRRVLGRYLGRLHRLGAAEPFRHRPVLDVRSFGHDAVRYLVDHTFLPDYLREPYTRLTGLLLDILDEAFGRMRPLRTLRLHGDCHLGNILWTEQGPHLVDLDDCRMGPAVQDLWMLLSGEREDMEMQLGEVLEGYTGFSDFDAAELALIEPLRTLRLMHYSAWLARRWEDPAFPRAFPWFNSTRYWEEHLQNLREQQALLQEPPLRWAG